MLSYHQLLIYSLFLSLTFAHGTLHHLARTEVERAEVKTSAQDPCQHRLAADLPSIGTASQSTQPLQLS